MWVTFWACGLLFKSYPHALRPDNERFLVFVGNFADFVGGYFGVTHMVTRKMTGF
jgi:hypothetical protein